MARPPSAAWLPRSWFGAVPFGYPSASCTPAELAYVSPKIERDLDPQRQKLIQDAPDIPFHGMVESWAIRVRVVCDLLYDGGRTAIALLITHQGAE